MADFSDIRAVLFDIGGTLLDFSRPESMAQFRAGLGDAHAYLATTGRSLAGVAAYRRSLTWRLLKAYLVSRLRGGELDAMAELSAGHARLRPILSNDELREVALRVYAPTHAIAHAHADAAAALTALRDRGFRLGVISNTIAPPVGLDAHLAAEGLLDLLPIRVYSCAVGVPKPNPRIFSAALELLKLPPEHVLYVGNKPKIDVAGARRAGMRTVLRVPAGMKFPRGPRADADIQEIAELPALLPARPRP
jgi:putative hydrolase of the HAD superfamily